MIKLIERKLSAGLKYECTYLCNNANEIAADFATECAIGSTILCVTGDVFIKNTEGKWQKFNTSEVIG